METPTFSVYRKDNTLVAPHLPFAEACTIATGTAEAAQDGEGGAVVDDATGETVAPNEVMLGACRAPARLCSKCGGPIDHPVLAHEASERCFGCGDPGGETFADIFAQEPRVVATIIATLAGMCSPTRAPVAPVEIENAANGPTSQQAQVALSLAAEIGLVSVNASVGFWLEQGSAVEIKKGGAESWLRGKLAAAARPRLLVYWPQRLDDGSVFAHALSVHHETREAVEASMKALDETGGPVGVMTVLYRPDAPAAKPGDVFTTVEDDRGAYPRRFAHDALGAEAVERLKTLPSYEPPCAAEEGSAQ